MPAGLPSKHRLPPQPPNLRRASLSAAAVGNRLQPIPRPKARLSDARLSAELGEGVHQLLLGDVAIEAELSPCGHGSLAPRAALVAGNGGISREPEVDQCSACRRMNVAKRSLGP